MTVRLSILLFVVFGLAGSLPAQWGFDPDGSGENGEQGDRVPSPVMDAMGDAVDTSMVGPPLLDIDTLHLTYGTDTLNFSLTFFDPIAPPSTGAANGMVGVIDLDVDQDHLTGDVPIQNEFSPPFTSLVAGIDFRIELFSETLHPGSVDIIDSLFEVVGTVPVTYTSTSISGVVPLSVFADDDGLVDFTAIIGTQPQPTDAMDVIGFSVPVPEPSGLALWLLGLVCCQAIVRKSTVK